MAARERSYHVESNEPVRQERPWLYPYNRRLRHLHGISLRNLCLAPAQSRQRGNTKDDAALPTALTSPAKQLAQLEHKQLGHSRSITDLKAIVESDDGTTRKADERAADASPGKRPARRTMRRRSTLDWQNASSNWRQQKLEDVISANMANVFFSLHTTSSEDPVYVSEVIEKTMNPDFGFLNLSDSGPSITRREDLTVKIWARNEKMDDYQYLVEMNVNLRSLQFIGKTIEGFPQPLPQNCILFHMKDGIYTSFLDNFTGEPSAPVSAPQRTMSVTQVLPTSSFDALMRLSTLDECIQDALVTRAKIESEITQILEDNAQAIQTVRDVSFRTHALENIRDATATERKRLATAKRRRDEFRARLAQRQEYIAAGHQAIQDGQQETIALKAEIMETKEKLQSTTEETLGQRRRICEDLQKIYPIIPLPNKSLHFSIASLPLANSHFDDADDETTAAALGHVALIVDRLQYYLSVPLPYPIKPRGSTSTIEDPISEVAGGQGKGGRLYPLFGRASGVRFRFEFGVFLLNKDVEILGEKMGLRIVDLRHTLPNLKYLLYVASAGKGEVPERKKGGIRGFLRGGGGAESIGSSRRGSEDSGVGTGGGEEGKGLMLPPPLPKRGLGFGQHDGVGIGNGKMKSAYTDLPVRGSRLREHVS